MKVTISASWRWHAWDLARELHGLGHLRRLHTIWRPWGRWRLPRSKVLVRRRDFLIARLGQRLFPSLRDGIEIGRRARAKAEKMNWAAYGRKVAEEYEKILAARRSPAAGAGPGAG